MFHLVLLDNIIHTKELKIVLHASLACQENIVLDQTTLLQQEPAQQVTIVRLGLHHLPKMQLPLDIMPLLALILLFLVQEEHINLQHCNHHV